jgi:bacteriocin resistance YdeI/OmpD-like protein
MSSRRGQEPDVTSEASIAVAESFPPSSRQLILEWIAIAKRPDTRRRRIDQTVNLAALNIRANHPRNTRVCPTLRHQAPTGTLQIAQLRATPQVLITGCTRGACRWPGRLTRHHRRS